MVSSKCSIVVQLCEDTYLYKLYREQEKRPMLHECMFFFKSVMPLVLTLHWLLGQSRGNCIDKLARHGCIWESISGNALGPGGCADGGAVAVVGISGDRCCCRDKIGCDEIGWADSVKDSPRSSDLDMVGLLIDVGAAQGCGWMCSRL